VASHCTLATSFPLKRGSPHSSTTPERPLGQALIAVAIGIGGEFALAIALMPFAREENPSPWLLVTLWTASVLAKGSLFVGLVGMLQSLLYGFLQGKTRSGVPTWLAWMALLLL
jgi:hypothetical protein